MPIMSKNIVATTYQAYVCNIDSLKLSCEKSNPKIIVKPVIKSIGIDYSLNKFTFFVCENQRNFSGDVQPHDVRFD
jgi:hypothetical protein